MSLGKFSIIFKISHLIFFLIFFTEVNAQNFINPDLEDTIITHSTLPFGWQSVPFTDPVCLANTSSWASPDLLSLTMPDSSSGNIGNPYSGLTFVSGMHAITSSGSHYQEGIMQTVSGFTIGSSYKINFHQSVVKQEFAADYTGLWLVYVDSNLIASTTPTYSAASVFSTSFIWDSRDAYFVAIDTVHIIKFLPFDDDLNYSPSFLDSTAALRMGIDSINLSFCFQSKNLGNDTIICSGDTINLDVTTVGATYVWQDNSTSSTFDVTQQGTYWVQVSNSTCSIFDTIVINNKTLPNFSLGNDTTLCESDSLMLDASTLNSTYLWQDNSIDSLYSVIQTGMYIVEVTNICGTTSDTVNVLIDTLTVNLGVDTILCKGDSLVLNAGNMTSTYLWQNGAMDSIFTVTQSGIYWNVITRGNCSKSDTINIALDSIPLLSLGADTIICEDEALLLEVTTLNSTYLWQDNSNDSIFLITEEGTYSVVVVNSCGISSDTLIIGVNNCNPVLEMPNVFTPNYDFSNDLFIPIQFEGIIAAEIKIFNRWGEEIFKSNRLMQGWDGRTTAGIEVPSGTYFWVIEFETENGFDSQKGTLTLLRD